MRLSDKDRPGSVTAELPSSASGEAQSPVPVSVVVLTYNEESNLPGCLASICGWAAEVFIVDSGSIDRTQEIAREYGTSVVAHPFEGYSRQRNWALANLPFSCHWVLFVDADERVGEELRQSMSEVLSHSQAEYTGYYVKRRFVFLRRWIRHGGYYPVWILRLFRRDAARCEDRSVNEHFVVTGRAGHLEGDLIHEDQRGLSDWLVKHVRYARLEALELENTASRQDAGESKVDSPSLGSQAGQKRWLRERIWNRMPPLLRPFLYFAYRYVVRAGFLDGWQGFVFHILQGLWFPFIIDVLYLEQRCVGADPPRSATSSSLGHAVAASGPALLDVQSTGGRRK